MKLSHFLRFAACLVLMVQSIPSLMAQSCSGNLLTDAGGYYGGFEIGSLSIGATRGRTDLTYGSAHGQYQIVDESMKPWDDIQGGGYLPLTPHSGNFFMLIHTDNSRLWYKSISVVPGETYNFCAWIASAKENPVSGFEVQLRVKAGSTTTVIATSKATQGKWTQICGLYTVPAGITSAEFQIIDPFPDGPISNFLALDDICLRLVSAGPLPVKLTSFTGKKQNGKIILNWETASEINADHFTIEYSANGRTWQALDKVTAAGNSNAQKAYSYIHANPANGSNYYRLQLVDVNGNTAASNVVFVRMSDDKYAVTAIFPNPFTSNVQLTVYAEASAQVTVQIFDMNGRLMQKVEKPVAKGESQLTVNKLRQLVDCPNKTVPSKKVCFAPLKLSMPQT